MTPGVAPDGGHPDGVDTLRVDHSTGVSRERPVMIFGCRVSPGAADSQSRVSFRDGPMERNHEKYHDETLASNPPKLSSYSTLRKLPMLQTMKIKNV